MDVLIRALADFSMIPLLLVAGYGLLFKASKVGRYDRYVKVVMAGLTSYWLAKVIGNVWQPTDKRPFEHMGVDPGASYLGNAGFPSDHVLFAAFLTLAMWYAVRRPMWTLTMALLTLTIAVGRVLALVHSPVDVVGGLAIALLGAVWYVDYAKTLFQTGLAKKSKK
jgi:membrane-associated phospholipid phosphatase